MSEPAHILQAIGRLRRAMPRNHDVILVCDEIERHIVTVRNSAQVPKFDRVAYQRGYMRKWRAKRRQAEKKS